MTRTLPDHWAVKETPDDVAKAVRDIILQSAQQAIQERGIFKIVLAGGTTPKQVYALLAKESCDWEKWHFYLGDERCLPVKDSERNSQMVQHTLFDKVNVPAENIHFIPTEQGAKQAAINYSKEIKDALPFNMVLLGMGEDGHTASLFPNHSHQINELVHAVYDAPKPPSDRVSLSVKALSNTYNLLILVTGSSKNNAVKQWLNNENLPVTQIGSLSKKTIFLDKGAFS